VKGTARREDVRVIDDSVTVVDDDTAQRQSGVAGTSYPAGN
jgi:hypothetical protein